MPAIAIAAIELGFLERFYFHLILFKQTMYLKAEKPKKSYVKNFIVAFKDLWTFE